MADVRKIQAIEEKTLAELEKLRKEYEALVVETMQQLEELRKEELRRKLAS